MPAKRAKPPKRKTSQTRPSTESGARRQAATGVVSVRQVTDSVIATLDFQEDRPLLTPAMARDLIDLAEVVEDDHSVHALVVRGSGSVFCAGFEEDVDARVVETLATVSKPTVAFLNGDARDEGLELALALDIRMGLAGSAYALGQLTHGVLPHFGGTQRLPRLIGVMHALPMILTGDPLGADAAMRLGLLTYLAADAAELERMLQELLETLASRGIIGVQMVKDAVRKGFDMTLEQGIRLEEDLYALLQTTADRAEGVRAFLEKRKPLFKGA